MTSPPTRTLWLLRHAKAVADPPSNAGDFDRTLAPRGRRDAGALGRMVGHDGRGLGLGPLPLPQLALVSPAARTRATAQLVLQGMPTPVPISSPPDLYGADPEEVLTRLRALEDDTWSTMVVGHNPTMHALAVGLIHPEDEDDRILLAQRGFPTCALGIYRLDVARWTDLEGRRAHLLGLFTPPFERV